MSILQQLGKDWVFFDGGTGSLLQKAGLRPGEAPESWNLTHPEEILRLHKEYILAGSDVILTNTFGLNALRFPGQVEVICRQAVSLAQEARRASGRHEAAVALDLGPTGRLLKPLGDLDFEMAVRLYSEVVSAGAEAGADAVMIETMGDVLEMKAAVLAAKESCTLPVFVTMTFDAGGKMLTGGTPEAMVAMLEGLHVNAVGINCSLGPEQMLPLVQRMAKVASLPLIVKPNAGLPRVDAAGQTVYDISPEQFARFMGEIASRGVHALGGCCGTTPEYIRRMIAACRPLPFQPPQAKRRSVISSASRTAVIGERPLLIGERINPTGKKRFKEALLANDMDYILSEGLAQEDAGADILDVNVGLPGIEEASVLPQVVLQLENIVPLPLQLDTADPKAMEKALRLVAGKPLVNSVSGKQESMDAVFPLVARYGGVVVALLLDENGIPDTAAGRLKIAGRILREAAKYGIAKEDLVFDALAMAISAGDQSAKVTLETLRGIRDQLHANSILGVSNISFGLPNRPLINAAFLTMALESGLSCAILNPLNATVMDHWHAWLALSGRDESCKGLLAAFTGREASENASSSDALSLRECILRGLKSRVQEKTKAALVQPGADPLALIESQLIPALDEAGRAFEQGSLFLPQLLLCAEAASSAFEEVKRCLPASGAERGSIILATVKGDIHDIGKNIVKVLLENYGYRVLDLGKDVPPEEILSCALQENIRLVGLSALMTTTVGSMEETIRLLREKAPGVLVLVGGAVLNEDYARRIGADFYAKDAMAAVRIADSVFGKQ